MTLSVNSQQIPVHLLRQMSIKKNLPNVIREVYSLGSSTENEFSIYCKPLFRFLQLLNYLLSRYTIIPAAIKPIKPAPEN